MPVIATLSRALAVGSAYVPPTAARPGTGPFELSRPALENTLRYVFEYLSHQCYMLCVRGGEPRLYKLVPRTTAPLYKVALRAAVARLDANPTLTAAQRAFVARGVAGAPARVMQCVVKKFVPTTAGVEDTKNNEYLDVLRGAALPDGVFLLNLTDAVILRADGMHPFPMVVGAGVHIGAFAAAKHIPVLSLSGQRGYLDVPIPNYDDVLAALGRVPPADFATAWADKPFAQAVFRGGATGCGYTAATNARIRLATMRSPLLDAGITVTGAAKTIDSRAIKFDPVHGLGVLNTGIRPVARMSMAEQSRRKYIIHIDGNVSAYRLATSLATGSLILRVAGEYTSWLDAHIRAGEHYLEVAADLSDLLSTVEWCIAHDARCAAIAARGLAVARWAAAEGRARAEIQAALWAAAAPAGPPADAPHTVSIDALAARPEGAARCAPGFRKTRVAGRVACKAAVRGGGRSRGRLWRVSNRTSRAL